MSQVQQVQYVCSSDKSFDINDYEYLVSFNIFPEIFDCVLDDLFSLNINYRLVRKFYDGFSDISSLILFIHRVDFDSPEIKELIANYDL